MLYLSLNSSLAPPSPFHSNSLFFKVTTSWVVRWLTLASRTTSVPNLPEVKLSAGGL